MVMREVWTSLLVAGDPGSSTLQYGPHQLGELGWTVDLEPGRASATEAILLGLNTRPEVTGAWEWTRIPGTFTVRILHAGRECAQIAWDARVRNKGHWSQRAAAGLNACPHQLAIVTPAGRPTEYVWADFDVNDLGAAS